MSAFQELFFDLIRQGLPTIGSISGLVWATADGTTRDRKAMLLRGALGATVGWGIGYGLRWAILKGIDNIPGAALPGDVASLGPVAGKMGMTEVETMPNPTYHPRPTAREKDQPEPTILDGEGSQVINLPSKRKPAPKKPPPQDDVKVEGTLSSDAFGKI